MCETHVRDRHSVRYIPMDDKIFLKQADITIINDDCLTTQDVHDSSIDLIVTSPPYNVDIQYESHNDGTSYDDYLEFSRQWLSRCLSFLKDDGRLCLNVPLDKNKGGQQSVGADLTTIAKNVGYQYHSTIIWYEDNISRRTAWGSWMSASAPYVIAPVELIVVLYKKQWKKMRVGKTGIKRQEFLDWTNGVWKFSGESKKRVGHPSPFPVELPRRCIKLFSFENDIILDPFMGSGTTLMAARLNKRRVIGVEIERSYCEIAKQRLKSEKDIIPKTIIGLTMEYFKNHPNEDLTHGPVVDWVTEQWLKSHNTPPRDVWRSVRDLHEKGMLIKVAKGIYRYDPD